MVLVGGKGECLTKLNFGVGKCVPCLEQIKMVRTNFVEQCITFF